MRFVVVCIVSCSLFGCSSYRDPRMQLGQAHVVDRTDVALAVHVPIELTNPNNEPLELLEFEYKVEVNGQRAYSGKRAAQATLRSGGTRHAEIPFVVPFERLGWSAENLPHGAEYRIHGHLVYITPGEIAQIFFDTGVRTPRAGFAESGNLQIR